MNAGLFVLVVLLFLGAEAFKVGVLPFSFYQLNQNPDVKTVDINSRVTIKNTFWFTSMSIQGWEQLGVG